MYKKALYKYKVLLLLLLLNQYIYPPPRELEWEDSAQSGVTPFLSRGWLKPIQVIKTGNCWRGHIPAILWFLKYVLYNIVRYIKNVCTKCSMMLSVGLLYFDWIFLSLAALHMIKNEYSWRPRLNICGHN